MSTVRFADSPTKNVGALTSYESLLAGGDKTKEVLLRKKEKSYDKVMALVLKETVQQRLAGIHYQALNDYALYMPTMLITLSSAAISILLASEEIKTNDSKVTLGIIVAFLQLILSVFQSLSKQLNLGGKTELHLAAARSLKNMYLQAKLLKDENRYNTIYKAIKTNRRLSIGVNSLDKLSTNLNAEDNDETKPDEKGDKAVNAAPNGKEDDETNGKDNEDEDMEETATLTERYKQSLQQADSQVPFRISSAFDMMESRINVINKSMMTNKTSSLVSWEKLMPALYYQLSETIVESHGWPLVIPSPRKSVDRALKLFKLSLDVERDNNADLLMTLLTRGQEINCAKAKMLDAKKKREMERSAYSDIPKTDTSDDDSQNRAMYGYGSV